MYLPSVQALVASTKADKESRANGLAPVEGEIKKYHMHSEGYYYIVPRWFTYFVPISSYLDTVTSTPEFL